MDAGKGKEWVQRGRAPRAQPSATACHAWKGDDAVVVLAKGDYERLVAPQNFVDFLRNSPMAEAVAAGDFGDPSVHDPSAHDPFAHDPFARPRDMGRSIELA